MFNLQCMWNYINTTKEGGTKMINKLAEIIEKAEVVTFFEGDPGALFMNKMMGAEIKPDTSQRSYFVDFNKKKNPSTGLASFDKVYLEFTELNFDSKKETPEVLDLAAARKGQGKEIVSGIMQITYNDQVILKTRDISDITFIISRLDVAVDRVKEKKTETAKNAFMGL